MGVSGVHLTVPILKTHDVGILAIHPWMTPERAVATKANTVTVVDSVVLLATPRTLLGVMCAFFGNTIADRGTNPLDLCGGEGGGDVKGGIDTTLKASEHVGPSEMGGTVIEGLSLYL